VKLFPSLCCLGTFISHCNNKYRAIPWIGVDAAYLNRSRRSEKRLIISYTIYLIISYFMFGACYYLWAHLFLNKPHIQTLNDSYFTYIGVFEFLNLLFIRTRLSIKFFPRMFTLLNILFLSYHFTYFFPFSQEALTALFLTSFTLFLGFLLISEIPALERNPFGPFTPSTNNPRMAYLPVSIRSFSLGFELWSMFCPGAFRTEFIQREQELLNDENEPILPFDFSTDPDPEFENNNERELRRIEPPEGAAPVAGGDSGEGELEGDRGYDMDNIRYSDENGEFSGGSRDSGGDDHVIDVHP
jgi:hypothetical protein